MLSHWAGIKGYRAAPPVEAEYQVWLKLFVQAIESTEEQYRVIMAMAAEIMERQERNG